MSPETAELIATAERIRRESAACVEELHDTIARARHVAEEYRRWREHITHVHQQVLRKMIDEARQEAATP